MSRLLTNYLKIARSDLEGNEPVSAQDEKFSVSDYLKDRERKVQAAHDELSSVVGTFLTEFAMFESTYLSSALRTLSHDPTLVDFLEDLMDLEKRLRLLKRLAEAQRLPAELMSEVKAVRTAAIKLLENRNEVAHGAAANIGGYEVKNTDSFVLAVQLPMSKQKMPPGPITDVEEWHALAKSWHRTVPEIRVYIDRTKKLQSLMMNLTERLARHMRAEAQKSARQ
jgi:hypothetical protein